MRVARPSGRLIAMNAVTIHDLRTMPPVGVLAIDLIDVLRLAESAARASVWTCDGVEAVGEGADELEGVATRHAAIGGDEMFRLASGVDQIIDGWFSAASAAGESPWLIVQAVDSSLYVVITDDVGLMSRILQQFTDVRPSPEDARLR